MMRRVLECDTPQGGLVGEYVGVERGVDRLSGFPAWMPRAVFPCFDDGLAAYVDQFGQIGLRVSVTVPPIFEPLYAGRLVPDEPVVDRRVPAVVFDGVEESRVRVLMHEGFLAFDGDGEWFLCHGVLISFRLAWWWRGFPP